MIKNGHAMTMKNGVAVPSPVYNNVEKDEMNDGTCKDDQDASSSKKVCVSEAHKSFKRFQDLLDKAERHLLQKQYKEALFSVNQAFVRMNSTGANELKIPNQPDRTIDVLVLSPSIQLPSSRRVFQFAFSIVEPPYETNTAVSVSHQLAVIGLQSWHELSSRDRTERSPRPSPGKGNATSVGNQAWNHLEPMLNYFAVTPSSNGAMSKQNGEVHAAINILEHPFCRTLSIDLMPVWIPFWEAHGYEKEAFLWATQILVSVATSRIRCDAKKMMRMEEMMWLHYVCHQLSHLNDADMADMILRFISTTTDNDAKTKLEWQPQYLPDPLIDSVEQAWDASRVHPDTINNLLGTIETLLGKEDDETKDEPYGVLDRSGLSFFILSKARENLLKLWRKNGKSRSSPATQQQQNQPSESSVVSSSVLVDHQGYAQVVQSNGVLSSENSNSVPNRVASYFSFPPYIAVQRNRIFRWLSQVLQNRHDWSPQSIWNICTAENDTATLRQRRRRVDAVVLSLAFLLLSWRQRRLVGRLGRSVAMALLAPIREVVDALVGPPSQRATIGHDNERRRAS